MLRNALTLIWTRAKHNSNYSFCDIWYSISVWLHRVTSSNMYFVVSIKGAKNKKLIPSKWIRKFDYVLFYNYGITYIRKYNYVIFFSNNFEDEPDFQSNTVLNTFDENTMPACYDAKIVDSFGMVSNYFLFYKWNLLRFTFYLIRGIFNRHNSSWTAIFASWSSQKCWSNRLYWFDRLGNRKFTRNIKLRRFQRWRWCIKMFIINVLLMCLTVFIMVNTIKMQNQK